jgi:hypothetical protein
VLADDPRTFAPLAVESRTRAVVTPVPHAGALLRDGTTSRRGVPWWGVTMRVLDGPACGAHAALRLWPASANRAWFARRVSDLTGLDRETAAGLEPAAARAAVEHALACTSYRATVETGSSGELEIAFIDARLGRVEPHPTLPSPAPPTAVPPPTAPAAPLLDPDAVRYELVTDRAGLAALCERVAAADIVALDIETDCGPLGSPEDWEPSDGAIRLVQVALPLPNGGVHTAVVDCYRVPPDPLVRLLAAPRRIVAHNARYEQRWLAFHHGVPPWRDVLDTCVAFRVLERHWAALDPAYEAQEATLAHVLERMLGIGKAPFGSEWWGADELPPAQLQYAAVDAAALLALATRVEQLAHAMGCFEQVLAASRAACREAARRMPAGREALYVAMVELIAEADDRQGLDGVGHVARTVSLAHADRVALRDAFRSRLGELTAREAAPAWSTGRAVAGSPAGD